MEQKSGTSVSTPRRRTSLSSQQTTSLVYLIAFLDLFAVSMLAPLLRKELLNMGCSFTTAGLVGSIYGAAQLFSSPVVGDWSDYYGRKRILLFTLTLASAGYFLLSVSHNLWLFALARIICGCFKHTQTLSKAFLADVDSLPDSSPGTGDHDHAEQRHAKENKSFGSFMTFSTLGWVIGPIFGGHIAEYQNGFQIVCALVATAFILNCSLTHLFLVDIRGIQKSASVGVVPDSIATDVKVARKTLWKNSDIFVLQLFVSLSVLIVRTNYVQHIEKTFGVPVKWAGYISSYQALVGVLGSACVTRGTIMRHYESTKKLMLHTTMAIGLSIIGISTTDSFLVYLLSLTVLNFSTPFSRLANIRQITDRSKGSSEHYGLLIGFGQSVGSFSRLSSSFLSGVVQDYFSAGPEVVSVAFTSLAVFQILVRY